MNQPSLKPVGGAQPTTPKTGVNPQMSEPFTPKLKTLHDWVMPEEWRPADAFVSDPPESRDARK